jgi:hypothetical protein
MGPSNVGPLGHRDRQVGSRKVLTSAGNGVRPHCSAFSTTAPAWPPICNGLSLGMPTQAVSSPTTRGLHSEIGQTPLDIFLGGPR